MGVNCIQLHLLVESVSDLIGVTCIEAFWECQTERPITSRHGFPIQDQFEAKEVWGVSTCDPPDESYKEPVGIVIVWIDTQTFMHNIVEFQVFPMC